MTYEELIDNQADLLPEHYNCPDCRADDTYSFAVEIGDKPVNESLEEDKFSISFVCSKCDRTTEEGYSLVQIGEMSITDFTKGRTRPDDAVCPNMPIVNF